MKRPQFHVRFSIDACVVYIFPVTPLPVSADILVKAFITKTFSVLRFHKRPDVTDLNSFGQLSSKIFGSGVFPDLFVLFMVLFGRYA